MLVVELTHITQGNVNVVQQWNFNDLNQAQQFYQSVAKQEDQWVTLFNSDNPLFDFIIR